MNVERHRRAMLAHQLMSDATDASSPLRPDAEMLEGQRAEGVRALGQRRHGQELGPAIPLPVKPGPVELGNPV